MEIEKACTIKLCKNYTHDYNMIYSLSPCCDKMAEAIMGDSRVCTLHRYQDELLSKNEAINYCSYCGGKIIFFDEKKRYDDFRDQLIFLYKNDELRKFQSCCERLSEAVAEKYITYNCANLRFMNESILNYCPFCGTEKI